MDKLLQCVGAEVAYNTTVLFNSETHANDVFIPNYSSTYFVLVGNGDLTDQSFAGQTVTVNGSVAVNTATKKYGYGSIYKPSGSSNYLNIPAHGIHGNMVNFGTGDFTIEFWGYTTNNAVGCLAMSATDGTTIIITVGENGTGQVSAGVRATSWNVNSANNAIPNNTWKHIAVSRSSGVGRIHIDGVMVSSAAWTTNFTGASNFQIGRRETSYGAGECYFDDIKITYTGYSDASFTPSRLKFAPSYGYNSVPVNIKTNSSYFSNSEPTLATIDMRGAKFGTYGMRFDGDTFFMLDIMSDAYFTGDFTVEAWVYPKTISSMYDAIFSIQADCEWCRDRYNNLNNQGLVISTNLLCIGAAYAGSYSSPVSVNQWSHIACCRVGSNVTVYINGVSVLSVTNSASLGTSTASRCAIGVFDSVSTGGRYYFNGFIDDFRITKDAARYTANFTPPTSALTV